MCCQVNLLVGTVVAVCTPEAFLSRVNPKMSRQIPRFDGSEVTEIALVRLVSCVHPKMHLKAPLDTCVVVTNITLERLFCGVQP